MARVQFTALIEEVVGKLAGSVFQDSYQGFQLRTRVSPRNPQSAFQQLRRGEYGFITQLWRELTPTQRDSWLTGAPMGVSSFQFFVTCNCNLALTDRNPISTYIDASQPATMDANVVELTTESFIVTVASGTTVVPAGHTLVLFSTYLRGQQQVFTNPSMFSPIASFPEGTDMAVNRDVYTSFVARFGQITADKRLCIKTALINNSNGLRTDGAVSCANSTVMPNNYIPLFGLSEQVESDGTVDQVLLAIPIPNNYINAKGSQLIMRVSFFIDDATKVDNLQVWTDYDTLASFTSFQTSAFGYLEIVIQNNPDEATHTSVEFRQWNKATVTNQQTIIDWFTDDPAYVYIVASTTAADQLILKDINVDYITPPPTFL